MMNLLSLFCYFNKATNIVVFAVLFLIIVVGIVIMLKFPSSRKIMLYIFAVVVITVGSMSAFGLYKDVTAKSYVVGSLDYEYLTTQESLTYIRSSISFYKDDSVNNGYYYEDNLLKTEDFNGLEHEYLVKLNDYVLTNTIINAGSIYSVINIDFYDVENDIVCNACLDISIQFLSDKTKLRMNTSLKDVPYLEDYFSNYGFNLEIVEKNT